MKTLPPDLAAHLAGGATTLAWCWRLTRRDGVRLGFTDHDVDLSFDGTVFEASAGFTASEIRESVGLSVDDLEVESALTSGRLSEVDLASGQYDDARVEIWRVNWQQPSMRVLMRTGSLGDVRRAGRAFSAEVRGLAHYLAQPTGRLYQYTCDADFGDARCKIDLADPRWRLTGTVVSIEHPSRIEVAGLGGFETGWLARGVLEVTSGAATGFRVEIKGHVAGTAGARLTLWQPAPETLAPGASVRATAGCDKHLATCRDRFANAVNFRGFPHMPGNDFVTSYARRGQTPRSGARG